MRLSSGSACLVFRLGNRHLKVAVTPGARRGLLREARGAARAAADAFWSPYVQQARFYGGVIKQAPFRDAAAADALSKILPAVRRRIDALSPTAGGWADRFGCITAIANSHDRWPMRLDEIFAGEVCASCHGDLCVTNCLDSGGAPILIDWGNFRTEFWAPYDACHPDLVRWANESGDSWFTCLQKHLGKDGWDLPRTIRYLICRVELEADQDIAMGRLDGRRRAKYREALTWAGAQLAS